MILFWETLIELLSILFFGSMVMFWAVILS